MSLKVISGVAGEHGKLEELEMALKNDTCCWRQVLSLKCTEAHINFFKKFVCCKRESRLSIGSL